MFRTGETRPDSESAALLDLDVRRIILRVGVIMKRVVIAALF